MTAKRKIRGTGPDFPLYAVDDNGNHHFEGMLTAIQGGFLWEPDGGGEAVTFGHLPWFVRTLAPEGFLGRIQAQQWHGDIPVAPRLADWGDNDFIVAAALRGENMPGHFILGSESLSRWLDAKSRQESYPLQETDPDNYPDAALRTIQGGNPGSSAGGEQPKFTAFNGGQHKIVKFSPPLGTPAGRRWGDLLVCEHLAHQSIREAGLAAAGGGVSESGGRMFLEVDRFDRQGPHGRSPMASLGVVDDELFGYRDSWENAAARLFGAGLLEGADRDAILWLAGFGRLIGNTDRHFGNISLGGFDAKGEIFVLLPAYDTLPMCLAPVHGEVTGREVELPVAASGGYEDAALRFWGLVADDPRVSPEFSVLARETLYRLEDCLNIGLRSFT